MDNENLFSDERFLVRDDEKIEEGAGEQFLDEERAYDDELIVDEEEKPYDDELIFDEEEAELFYQNLEELLQEADLSEDDRNQLGDMLAKGDDKNLPQIVATVDWLREKYLGNKEGTHYYSDDDKMVVGLEKSDDIFIEEPRTTTTYAKEGNDAEGDTNSYGELDYDSESIESYYQRRKARKKKRIILFSFLSAVLILVLTLCWVKWPFDALAKGITVKKIDGEYVLVDCNDKKEEYVIPKYVTKIGDDAFRNCTNLKSVTIPDSVTKIGMRAFLGCTSLTTVTLSNTITYLPNSVFSQCSSLKTVTIPKSLKAIDLNVFMDCSSLEDVVYLGSVEEWCKIEFEGLDSNPLYNSADLYINNQLLSDLVIPESITEIKNYAFVGCSSLNSVVISDATTVANSYAFGCCPSLTSMETGGVKRIVSNVFYGCPNLEVVKIGSGANFISNTAFMESNAIKEYAVSQDNQHFMAVDGNLYSKDGTSLIKYASGKRDGQFQIPNTVKDIGTNAFTQCESLYSLIIPSSVESFQEKAFDSCYQLVEIYNLSGVNIIAGAYDENDSNVGLYALDVYTSLEKESKLSSTEEGYVKYTNDDGVRLVSYRGDATDLTLPDEINSIQLYAFRSVDNLKNITLSNSITEIRALGCDKCDFLESVTLGNSVVSIKDFAFANCKTLSTINLPDTLTEIKSFAFSGCASLSSVILPNSLTSVGESAFSGCASLSSVTLPNSLTSVGDSAFSGCTSLSSVTLPDSLTIIGNNVFSGCTSLSSVRIPRSVKTMLGGAFENCYSLANVNYLGTVDEWCAINFGNERANPLSYGASFSINGEVQTYLSINNTVNEYAFYGCSSITGVNIEAHTIGIGAFRQCKSLTKVTIGTGVQAILPYAFSGCDALKKVTFEETKRWFRTADESVYKEKIFGTRTNVKRAKRNARLLTNRHVNKYWFRRDPWITF